MTGQLVACRDCGAQISKSAERCPSCGRETVGLGGTLFGMAVFFGILFVIALIAVLLGWI